MGRDNQKSWGSLFFDEVFGTNSPTRGQKKHWKRERQREKENRQHDRLWARAQKQMNRDAKKNGW